MRDQVAHSLPLPLSAGDQCCGAGLPPATPHGLPHCPAPADAGLLGAGPQPEAQICTDCQHAGQAHPQCCQPEGHRQRPVWVSDILFSSQHLPHLQGTLEWLGTELWEGGNKKCPLLHCTSPSPAACDLWLSCPLASPNRSWTALSQITPPSPPWETGWMPSKWDGTRRTLSMLGLPPLTWWHR